MASSTHESSPLLHALEASAAEASRSKFHRAIVGTAACSALAVAAVVGLRGGAPLSVTASALGASTTTSSTSTSTTSSSAITSEASSTRASVSHSAGVPLDPTLSSISQKYPVAKTGQDAEDEDEMDAEARALAAKMARDAEIAADYRRALGPALDPANGEWVLSEKALEQVASSFANRVGETDPPWFPEIDTSPPAPASPPYPGLLDEDDIVRNELDSQLDFSFAPGFPGTKPEPSNPGKKVVMVPVANIGASGLSDDQVKMVLANKAKNAGVGIESLKRRGFYYGVVGEFEVTNAVCAYYGLNLMVALDSAIQQAFTIARGMGLINPNPTGVNLQHCEDVYDGVYRDFNARARMLYVTAVNRDQADSKEIITEFIGDVTPVPFARDFNALVNKAILDANAVPKGGVTVIETKRKPRLVGWIAIEAVEGIADALKLTNGAVLAAESAP